jgi:peptidyl-prolyl cis-trans isomerase SurA
MVFAQEQNSGKGDATAEAVDKKYLDELRAKAKITNE